MGLTGAGIQGGVLQAPVAFVLEGHLVIAEAGFHVEYYSRRAGAR